jgi:ParB-like chromosome segregation protein Spo0J
MEVNWIDAEVDVQTINKQGVSVVDKEIRIDQIDEKASAQNRARRIALDIEHTESIYLAMLAGNAIPKIVVRQVNNRYVIVGGNHRFSASKKIGEANTLPVHCVETTDVEFEQLCRMLNLNNGLREDASHILEDAVDAVMRLGMNVQTVASMYQIKPSRLSDAVKAYAIKQRLSRLSPRHNQAMTQTHALRLGELAINDNVLKAAAEFVTATRANAAEVGELAKKARKLPTEAAQVDVFVAAKGVKETLSKRSIPRPKRKAFLTWLTSAEKLLKGNVTWQSLELLNEEVPEISERLKSVKKCLNILLRVDG